MPVHAPHSLQAALGGRRRTAQHQCVAHDTLHVQTRSPTGTAPAVMIDLKHVSAGQLLRGELLDGTSCWLEVVAAPPPGSRTFHAHMPDGHLVSVDVDEAVTVTPAGLLLFCFSEKTHIITCKRVLPRCAEHLARGPSRLDRAPQRVLCLPATHRHAPAPAPAVPAASGQL